MFNFGKKIINLYLNRCNISAKRYYKTLFCDNLKSFFFFYLSTHKIVNCLRTADFFTAYMVRTGLNL